MQHTNRIGEKRPQAKPQQSKSANGATAQTAKGLETMNSNDNNANNDSQTDSKPQTEQTDSPKPQDSKPQDSPKGKGKSSKPRKPRKARKDATPKWTLAKSMVAIVQTVKVMVALPQFGKAFGGEVQKSDLPIIQGLATDKPKIMQGLNAIIGNSERQTMLRMKKSALVAFCTFYTSANPAYSEALSEASNGAHISTMGKLTLTVAILETMDAPTFKMIYKAIDKVANG